jgi:2-amino-4-hydroxy-6-hydroxymethyldihydropteridine diphosphokinase
MTTKTIAPTFTLLSLGSNLGDRLFHINSMEQALRSIFVDNSLKSSRIMETEPVGGLCLGQPAYLNKIVAGYYRGDAYGLLGACLAIEADLGRARPSSLLKAARTADADILLFGDEGIRNPPELIIPHPELTNRRFCLEGMMDIDPSITLPISGRRVTVRELYENMAVGVAAQNVSFL